MKIGLLACVALIAVGCGDDDDDVEDGAVDAIADAQSRDAELPDGDSGDAAVDDGGDADEGDGDAAADADAEVGDASQQPDVEWTTMPEPLMIDSDVGIDFAYFYTVTGGDLLTDRLLLSECTTRGGETEETCVELAERDAVDGSIRSGIDPSQYSIGTNRYRFIASLRRSGSEVDSDEIELVAEVTDCTTCGM